MDLKFNERANLLVQKIIDNIDSLKVEIAHLSNGARIIDCGVVAHGSYEAGVMASEIGMGGFSKVQLVEPKNPKQKTPSVLVDLEHPGVVTLCSQGAFPIFENQKSPFYISGPGRVLFRKPKEIYDFFEYTEITKNPVFIIEDDEYPTVSFVEKLSQMAQINASNFTFVVVPIPSLAGNVEVASKTIEDVMFNLFLTFNWDVRKISRARSITPVMPVFSKEENKFQLTPDDYIFYGGEVELYVKNIDDQLKKIVPKIVFENTPGFGKLFLEMVKEANGNVREINGYPYIFSPAKITVISVETGETLSAGHNNMDYLFELIDNKMRE